MTKIVHFCSSSYQTGSVGGVARFDDHIKELLLKEYIFHNDK